jgi:hypothetical protein
MHLFTLSFFLLTRIQPIDNQFREGSIALDDMRDLFASLKPNQLFLRSDGEDGITVSGLEKLLAKVYKRRLNNNNDLPTIYNILLRGMDNYNIHTQLTL